MEQSELSSTGKSLCELMEFEDQEKLVYEIRKHPFGLVPIYFIGIFVSFALMIAFFGSALFLDKNPLSLDIRGGSLHVLIVLIGTVLTLGTLLMTFIAAYLYQSNVILITSNKMTQMVYRTLFNRTITQLGVGDIEDVSVTQNGVFARIFNFGTLLVETAGEKGDYTFTYVPKPYEASKAVMSVHEENMKKYGN